MQQLLFRVRQRNALIEIHKQALTIAGLVGAPRLHGPMAHDSGYMCDLAVHLQTVDTCRGRRRAL